MEFILLPAIAGVIGLIVLFIEHIKNRRKKKILEFLVSPAVSSPATVLTVPQSQKKQKINFDFIALDFETANSYRGSACSIGLAGFKDGRVVDESHFFIKPRELKFDYWNVQIHGITEQKVRNKPEFDYLYNKHLKQYLEGNFVVAHNASFDMSVLNYLIKDYNLEYPKFEYLCTYKLSKLAFPELESCKLDLVCERLNISLQHHDAASDAKACGLVLVHILEQYGAKSIIELCEKEYVKVGVYDGQQHLSGVSKYVVTPNSSIVINPKVRKLIAAEEAEQGAKLHLETDPKKTQGENLHDYYTSLKDKRVVVTGTISGLTRDEIDYYITKAGGIPCPRVTKDTDILVKGTHDFMRYGPSYESSKEKRYTELTEKGHYIKLMFEDEFLSMLNLKV